MVKLCNVDCCVLWKQKSLFSFKNCCGFQNQSLQQLIGHTCVCIFAVRTILNPLSVW